jgi:hypothetical protein
MSGKLWTPDGVVDLDAKKKAARVELSKNLCEWFVQFSAFAQSQKIGIHCGLCGADIVGNNGASDRVFTVTCGCREWVGTNREYRPPPAAVN